MEKGTPRNPVPGAPGTQARDRSRSVLRDCTTSSSGKSKNEALGWASEGWTLEKAIGTLNDLKRNRRKGTGPRTLKEQRQEKELAEKHRQAEGLTVAEFWDQDYLNILKVRVKPSSAAREIREFETRIKPAIGGEPLKEVTEIDVERIIDKMRGEGLSPRSQVYLRGTFFRLWKHAARRKLVKAGDNPAAGIKLPQVNNGRLAGADPLGVESDSRSHGRDESE
jgi:hypothetical protein